MTTGQQMRLVERLGRVVVGLVRWGRSTTRPATASFVYSQFYIFPVYTNFFCYYFFFYYNKLYLNIYFYLCLVLPNLLIVHLVKDVDCFNCWLLFVKDADFLQ